MAKVSTKLYKCSACGKEQLINTNHNGRCMDHCKGCSWQAMAFPGVQMFGTWHRVFDHIKDFS